MLDGITILPLEDHNFLEAVIPHDLIGEHEFMASFDFDPDDGCYHIDLSPEEHQQLGNATTVKEVIAFFRKIYDDMVIVGM